MLGTNGTRYDVLAVSRGAGVDEPMSLMPWRLRAPDGLVHDGVSSSTRSFYRTVCEHRWGDKWSANELFRTDSVTTCLACLVEPERSHLPVLAPL